MPKTLFRGENNRRRAIKAPQNVDASGSIYKLGINSGNLLSNSTTMNNYTSTDIDALAIAGMRWIATGTDVPISSFVSSKETDKYTWTTEQGQADT